MRTIEMPRQTLEALERDLARKLQEQVTEWKTMRSPALWRTDSGRVALQAASNRAAPAVVVGCRRSIGLSLRWFDANGRGFPRSARPKCVAHFGQCRRASPSIYLPPLPWRWRII